MIFQLGERDSLIETLDIIENKIISKFVNIKGSVNL